MVQVHTEWSQCGSPGGAPLYPDIRTRPSRTIEAPTCPRVQVERLAHKRVDSIRTSSLLILTVTVLGVVQPLSPIVRHLVEFPLVALECVQVHDVHREYPGTVQTMLGQEGIIS